MFTPQDRSEANFLLPWAFLQETDSEFQEAWKNPYTATCALGSSHPAFFSLNSFSWYGVVLNSLGSLVSSELFY